MPFQQRAGGCCSHTWVSRAYSVRNYPSCTHCLRWHHAAPPTFHHCQSCKFPLSQGKSCQGSQPRSQWLALAEKNTMHIFPHISASSSSKCLSMFKIKTHFQEGRGEGELTLTIPTRIQGCHHPKPTLSNFPSRITFCPLRHQAHLDQRGIIGHVP